jgi:hypothetical protein
MLEGGCTCGRVRYRLASPPMFVNGCHCRDCQRFTGSAFAVNAMIEADRVVVTAGAPVAAEGERPAHCAGCGTRLWGHISMFGSPVAFVFVGTLDRGEELAPDAHFFVRSRHPWIVLPEGVPQFEMLPASDAELWGEAVRMRLDAALGGGVEAKGRPG